MDILLKTGSTGDQVKELQTLLHIDADGSFGSMTERAVMSYQSAHGLKSDGIIGPITWDALHAGTGPIIVPAPGIDIPRITAMAGDHPIAHYDWPGRGHAPHGYTKGVALSFANALIKLRAGYPPAVAMARANSGRSLDVLTHYAHQYDALGMKNNVDGTDTLRHLFALLLGLGMRESSGEFCCGRDTSTTNTSSETAEAGAWQMSWNARAMVPLLEVMMNEYTGDGFLSVYREGVTCSASNLENWGTGRGRAFQALCKNKPDFAAQAAALGLRTLRSHWGPIIRREATLRPEANDMLAKVQKIVEGSNDAIA